MKFLGLFLFILAFAANSRDSSTDYLCEEQSPKSFEEMLTHFFKTDELPSYRILPGPIHNGGIVTAEVAGRDEEKKTIDVKVNYNASAKFLYRALGKFMHGDITLSLPADFTTEAGYLNLEKTKTFELEKATLTHMGRVQIGNLKDVHYIKIVAKNGKSVTDLYYHPSLPGLGWSKIKVLLNLPGHSYTVEAELINPGEEKK